MKKCKKCGFETSEFTSEEFFHRRGNKFATKCKNCTNSEKRTKAFSDRLFALHRYSENGVIGCKCCGIQEIYFMELDHIDGSGSKHRKEMGEGGDRIIRWLKKHNWPDGYVVLCSNCNHAKSDSGECPHETARRKKVEIHSLGAENGS